MAKVKMPSEAQMRKQERLWQAQSLVRRKIEESPAFKREVRDTERELAKVEKKVKGLK